MGEGGLAGQRDFAARLRVLRRALQLFTTVMKATSSEQIVATEDRRLAPSFAEASRFWLKFGFISFGGPTAQIALLHGELVEKKRWISETRFFHALNFCMLLPGPEATSSRSTSVGCCTKFVAALLRELCLSCPPPFSSGV